MIKLSTEEQVAVMLIKNGITGSCDKINLNNVDFNFLFKFIDNHAVNMAAFDGINNMKSVLPKEVYDKWIYMASRKLTNREEVVSVHQQLTHLLEKNNIGYFVFKGLCAAYYYHRPELRETGDIDFYVDYSDFKQVNTILVSNGFKLISASDSKHWHYKFGNVDVEMHHSFWDMPDNKCSNFLKSYLSDIINTTSHYNFDNYSFYGPNPVSHAVILILHIINHIQNGGIGLRHICDFCVFLNSKDFSNNINEILEVLKKGGIFKITQLISKICFDYFGAPHYSFFDNIDGDICDLLFCDILRSGNFGRLSSDIYYGSAVITSNRGENNLLKSVFAFCQIAWKPCKKHKFLLPIAPFYIGTRYLFRMFMGKRPKINPIKLTKNSFERVELYKKLNFFEES